MSDLVGNPKDRFSHNEAQMVKAFGKNSRPIRRAFWGGGVIQGNFSVLHFDKSLLFILAHIEWFASSSF